MFSLLGAILLISSGIWIYNLNEKNAGLQNKLQRYTGISSQEDFEAELDQEINRKQEQASYLGEHCSSLEARVKELRKEVSFLDEEAEIQSFGFYDPVYNFITSDDYIKHLKSIRMQQRKMIEQDLAVECPIGWIVSDSKKEGEKLVKNFKKLILTIFNAECDAIIKGVKLGKISPAQAKIEKQFASLNKRSEVINCSITSDYLNLKIRELQLQYELEEKRQEEREIFQQVKQEEQDRKKLEKAEAEKSEAEDREQKYRKEIDTIEQQLESKHKEEQEALRIQLVKYQQLYQEAQRDREDAEYRSTQIKSGHIFVISNIGSFGRDVYRICSTRREVADQYVPSMNSIVPFPFDIHFKFFSGELNKTLTLLHEKFKDRRVNTVNPRRDDFFQVSFEEIAAEIKEIQKTGDLKNITVEKVPGAYEYRKTQQQKNPSNDYGKTA
jgi:Domain of unknown function (DUF4041)